MLLLYPPPVKALVVSTEAAFKIRGNISQEDGFCSGATAVL